MVSKKTLGIILSGVLALNGIGFSEPQIEKTGDLTGDGIKDVLVDTTIFSDVGGRYLFIGQKDGSFIRAKEQNTDDTKYFLTEEGTIYFFDGQNYRKIPKQK